MEIKVLVENTCSNMALGCEHGLSLYIKTEKHNILFDLGASNLFLENAIRLSVPIDRVDSVFISHGHDDHGGGLYDFLQNNTRARVYIRKNAFLPYYYLKDGSYVYTGLNPLIEKEERMLFTEGTVCIDEELTLFEQVHQNECPSTARKNLFQLVMGEYIADSFSHEQNLLIHCEGLLVLVTGCSHKGIVNILERCYELEGSYPDVVIGGFHLPFQEAEMESMKKYVKRIAERLMSYPSVYYTGHCTYPAAFREMKEWMGDRIHSISTGDTIVLGRSRKEGLED